MYLILHFEKKLNVCVLEYKKVTRLHIYFHFLIFYFLKILRLTGRKKKVYTKNLCEFVKVQN